MSFTDFVKPYPNGYEDGESGNTPVTAAILNTNYDGFLLALNSWASGMETSLNQKADSSSVGQAISSISGQLVNMQDAINQKSTVSLSDLLSTGTLIGTMVINGVTYNLYAPSGGSGGSSVEWEQIQLTGTKIAEVTIDGVTTDIYAPSGGSGGSGHTILDDDGTALAQEDDLQFVGVYSEDNSTDEVTKVNIYREMTKTEFDLLSDDEKKGFIRVTDEPDIYSDGHFQPVIYSTEEREIGVWTDGKPLYSKVVEIQSFSSSSPISIDVSSLNVDTMVDVVGEAYAISNNVITEVLYFPIYKFANIYTAQIRYSNNAIQIYHENLNEYTSGIVKILYTKTTDVAGSGTWTPQGVPAEHYSLDEQIIGTWIDGSTLYERCFEFSSDLLVPYDSYVATNISDNSYKQLVDCTGFYTPSGAMYKLFGYFDNGVLKLQTARNITSDTINKVLIQYTKSS